METEIDLDWLLAPLDESKRDSEFKALESKSFARDAAERFVANRRALFGFILFVVILLFAVFGPVFSPWEYDVLETGAGNLLPSAQHWFGTDKFGRDLFTRAMYGTRVSLLVGFVATAINTAVGTVYGGTSGYLGGRVDMLMMRVCDILYAVPSLLYIILIMLIFGSNMKSILIGMCLSGWIGIARLVRTQVLTLKEREYALASYVLGSTRRRIFFRHLLANAMGPILVSLTFMIPGAIFQEAFLSFIGIGISVPEASLGGLAQDARQYLQVHPYQILFPTALITLIIFSLVFISKGLEEALDPRNRR